MIKYLQNRRDTSKYEFIFVFSTGRCGTKHLSEVFGDKNAVVFHEKEHDDTYKVLKNFLIPIAVNNDRELAIKYMKEHRIPFMIKSMRENRAYKFFETGHLINYGIAPFLVMYLENIKFIRLKRDRYETVRSFMTRPAKFDIWNALSDKNTNVFRWSLHPEFEINTRKLSSSTWNSLDRFQKYLWYVDEIESQWKRLNDYYNFPFIEVALEDLTSDKYQEISDFIGINYNSDLTRVKHNTTLQRGGEKPSFSYESMCNFDKSYSRIMENII